MNIEKELRKLEFVPSSHPDGIGPYKCHVFMENMFKRYDDNRQKIEGSTIKPINLHNSSMNANFMKALTGYVRW